LKQKLPWSCRQFCLRNQGSTCNFQIRYG
jgi:hypothetical protein